MKYDEVLYRLKSNSDLDILRRMQSIGLDPSSAFAGGDWRNCDLSNLNLRNFDMRNADFRGAIFLGTDVSQADFRHSSVDFGLSVAKNFDSINIDLRALKVIDQYRENLKSRFTEIHSKENFIEKFEFETIIKNSLISYQYIKDKGFSRYGINYEKIKIPDYIIMNIINNLHEKYTARQSSLFVAQFFRLYNKKISSDGKINSIVLVEASKYLNFNQFYELIWPHLKNSSRFRYHNPAIYSNIYYSEKDRVKFVFELCKTKFKKM